MIKKIALRNIGPHKKVVLDLGKFVAFTGSSDTGKSELFRSLESVFLFQKMSMRFSETSASIQVLCDGMKIKRRRVDSVSYSCMDCKYNEKYCYERCPACGSSNIRLSRTKNEDVYTVEMNGKKTPYTKMGRGYMQLSPDIKSGFPIGCIMVGGKKPFFPGFRSQYENFIWKQLSNAEFSQVVSSLEGSDYVEIMIRTIKKELASERRAVKRLKDTYSFLKKEIASDKSELLEKKKDFDVLSSSYQAAQQHFDNIIAMRELLERFNGIQWFVSVTKVSINNLKIPEIEDKVIADQMELVGKLRRFRKKVKTKSVEIDTVKENIAEYDCEGIEEIEDTAIRLDRLAYLQKVLRGLATDKKVLSKTISLASQELAKLEEEIKEKFIDQDICPFTGWKLHEHCKKKML